MMIIDLIQTVAIAAVIIAVIAHQAAIGRMSRRIKLLADITTGRRAARLPDGRWDDADEDEDGYDGEEDEWHED